VGDVAERARVRRAMIVLIATVQVKYRSTVSKMRLLRPNVLIAREGSSIEEEERWKGEPWKPNRYAPIARAVADSSR
jgi:hypothetical protein